MNRQQTAKALNRMNERLAGRKQGPVRAKVVKQCLGKDDYSIDVQVLNVHDEPDQNWPVITQVEVDREFITGEGTGVFRAIAEETIVRVAFYDFDPNRPYLDAVIGPTKSPDVSGTTYWIKATGASVKVVEGGVSISAGGVSIGAGIVDVGASKDEEGNGGDINIIAENNVQIEGVEVLLGDGATEPVILGNLFIDLITALTVQGAPIDNVGALISNLKSQTVSSKVKVSE